MLKANIALIARTCEAPVKSGRVFLYATATKPQAKMMLMMAKKV